MSFVTVDLETFYDEKFSLSRMTTEEYIRDPQFEVIGVGMKIDDEETQWFSGTHAEIKAWLNQVDWTNSAMLCHNTQFDGAILAWIFDIVPAYYFDTLCMARAKHGVDVGGSLKALVERYKLGAKGTEVVDAKGKRRLDFTAAELDRYGKYCINDVDLTFKLFSAFVADYFPQSELDLIDLTLRMYTEPVLRVDDALLVGRLEEIKQEKSSLLRGLMDLLDVGQEEEVRSKLASNPQFAAILKDFGVEPPTKISPTTGKETYALAKNDEGFIELLENSEPHIQQLCAVRLGTKSTIEESRIERFISIGARNKGLLPIPLKYYGAHTGRWCLTGDHEVLTPTGWVRIEDWDGQAIRQWDPSTKQITWCTDPQWLTFPYEGDMIHVKNTYYKSVCTPEHRLPYLKSHTVDTVADITALHLTTVVSKVLFVSGMAVGEPNHHDAAKLRLIVAMHADGYDVRDDKNNMVRFRFTRLRKIERIKSLLTKTGIPFRTATYDSEPDVVSILIKGSEAPYWLRTAKTLPTWFYQLSAPEARVVVEELVHWDGYKSGPNSIEWCGKDYEAAVTYATLAHICGYRAKLTRVIKEHERWSDIYKLSITPTMHVREKRTVTEKHFYKGPVFCFKVDTGYFMCRYKDTIYVTGNSGADSVNFQNLPSRDKKKKTLKRSVLAPEGSVVINCDSSQIEARVLAWLAGQTDVVQAFAEKRDIYCEDATKVYGRVITKADPVERFVGKTMRLGLGYGTGAAKLRHTLKTQPPGADLTEEECKRLVDAWRKANDRIVDLWRECDAALPHLSSWPRGLKSYSIGKHDVVKITESGILLPNQLFIRYPDLKLSNNKYSYKSRRGVVSIWGGAMVENIVQALARIIVGEQMLRIREQYRPVLTVHDAAVIVVPENELDKAIGFITEVMSTPPAWATGLPVACEAKSGQSYGDCG